MPRYVKNKGQGYRKRYKQQNPTTNARIIRNLSHVELRTLQELAKHGMGYYTQFKDLLPDHYPQKIKPSSFQQYAGANTAEQLAQLLEQENTNHNDPLHESHMGGGLNDTHNALSTWAFNVSKHSESGGLDWVMDQLDPESVEDHSNDPIPTFDDDEFDENPTTTATDWIENVLENGNQIAETVDWIGGILEQTANLIP